MGKTMGEERRGLRVAVYSADDGSRAKIELNGASVLDEGKLRHLLATIPARARVVIGIDGELDPRSRAVLARWRAAYEEDGGEVKLSHAGAAAERGRKRASRSSGRMIVNRWRHGL